MAGVAYLVLQVMLLLVELRVVNHHDLGRVVDDLFSVVIPIAGFDEVQRMAGVRSPESEDPVHLDRDILDLVGELGILGGGLLFDQNIHSLELLLMLLAVDNGPVF